MQVNIQDLSFQNQKFWGIYLASSYPNAYLEEFNINIGDLIENALPINIEWYHSFTLYYDGVLDETDGYLDNPRFLKENIFLYETLLIEFHPGDTLYFFNGDNIGSTGPHWQLQTIPYEKAKSILHIKNGDVLFQLLLPLVKLERNEVNDIKLVLTKHFSEMEIKKSDSLAIIDCLISGIID